MLPFEVFRTAHKHLRGVLLSDRHTRKKKMCSGKKRFQTLAKNARDCIVCGLCQLWPKYWKNIEGKIHRNCRQDLMCNSWNRKQSRSQNWNWNGQHWQDKQNQCEHNNGCKAHILRVDCEIPVAKLRCECGVRALKLNPILPFCHYYLRRVFAQYYLFCVLNCFAFWFSLICLGAKQNDDILSMAIVAACSLVTGGKCDEEEGTQRIIFCRQDIQTAGVQIEKSIVWL